MAHLNFGEFFLEWEDSDIKIRLQTEQDHKEFEVPGHSIVIRRVSNLLKTMLESDNLKRSNIKVLELKTHGHAKDGIRFLRYLYTKSLEYLDIHSYVALLQTAHLYDVNDLSEICEKRIRHVVTPFSVCKIYNIVEKLVTEECLKFLLDLMLKSSFLIFENQLHISLNEDTLKLLLESNQLNVFEERQAANAILCWAKTRAVVENDTEKDYVKRKTAELLPLVRWSFIEHSIEFNSWFKFIDDNGDVKGTSKVERKPNPNVSLRRYCNVIEVTDGLISSTKTKLSDTIMSLQCSVNREIFLIGLGLHVETDCMCKELINWIHIYVNDRKPIDSYQTKEVNRGHQKTKEVFVLLEFHKPVLMKNVGLNEIAIRFPTFFSVNAQETVTVSGPIYRTQPRLSHARTFKPEPDVEFTICGEVIAVEKLYYLPK